MYLGYLKYDTTFNSNIIMQRKINFQQIVFINKKIKSQSFKSQSEI